VLNFPISVIFARAAAAPPAAVLPAAAAPPAADAEFSKVKASKSE